MTRFCELNITAGYGDPETWGGRRPYEPREDDETDEELDWISLQDLIDTLEEVQ